MTNVEKAFEQLAKAESNEAGIEGLQLLGIAQLLQYARAKQSQSNFEQVVQFHEHFKMQYDGKPRMLPIALLEERCDQLREELAEWEEACKENDLENMFDALIDLVVFAMGTAHLHGWNWEEGFKRVMAANLAKTRDPKLVNGKSGLIKPKGWKAPDYKDLV